MRPVITGVGVITSLGSSVESTWSRMLASEDGSSRIDRFDTTGYRVHVAHLIRDLDEISGHELSRMAARQAVADSGLNVRGVKGRVAVTLGTLGGDLRGLEGNLRKGGMGAESAVDSAIAAASPPDTFAAHAADEVGATGPRATFLTACSSSGHALAYAVELLYAAEIDAAIVIGIHLFSQTEFTYFHNLRSLARQRCQPFDGRRRGLMIGEGAGALVIEPLAAARQRDAHIYAEICGLGMTCDGYHVTSPHPAGEGAVRAMRRALERAQLGAEQIDYVSAHGTGTLVNDPVECKALNQVFGAMISKLPVSSVKSMIGHTMGASGVIETVICCLALRDSVIPPTANFEVADPACAIDCVPNRCRPARIRHVMKNSFGFGGNNVSLILGREQV